MKMQNSKHFSSSPMNLGSDLLALQNGGLDKSTDFCGLDLKLVCSDGYLMTHKALLPCYQSSASSTLSEELESWPLPLTIIQVSKLLFLIYTGEVLISKSDHTAIKPTLGAFKLIHVKRAPLSRGPTPTRTVNTRRRSSSVSAIATSGSSREELTRRKIAGAKQLPCGGEENVFIFGDGTIMEISTSASPASPRPRSTNLVYNLNGDIIVNESSDCGFHCAPCSLIFCDSSDFLEHSSSLACLNRSPPPPLTPTVKVIKLEADYIKVEEQVKVDTVYFEDHFEDHGYVRGEQGRDLGGPLNLCLICVTTCENAADLMVHSKKKHLISSEKDYDYGSWTCKWCHMTSASSELSVFLQHAYHCRKENRIFRKKSASTSPPRNKRRKTQTPPLITSNDNLTPDPLTPTLPPTPRTPQRLKDNPKVIRPMETEAAEPQPSSAPLQSPLVITKSFRIPKISRSNASTPSEKFQLVSNDDPNCPTPLIPRLPIKIKTSPQNNSAVRARRPKSLAIPNSHNLKQRNLEKYPFFSILQSCIKVSTSPSVLEQVYQMAILKLQ